MTTSTSKVAVITGASSGIGKAIALKMAGNGIHCALAARNEDKLKATAEACREKGVEALTIPTDVSKEADCKNLITKAEQHFGRLNYLVNNAGITQRGLFAEMDPAVMEQVMNINFRGTVYCTRYAINSLIENQGWVIGVSSIAGYRGLPGRTAYSASKFAMNGFLEALRTENLETGLKVLTLCPGFTASNIRNQALTSNGDTQSETPRDEAGMMQPEEVAKAMMKALRKQKKTLILTRQGKLTVWLNRFFNGFMDKLVFNNLAKEPGAPFGEKSRHKQS